jgi:HEAT repeat protein
MFSSYKQSCHAYKLKTGLFSAVVSAFLIEARKNLQPDPQATTNMLLQALLRSQNGPTATFSIPPFKPTLSSILINGLWVCSLCFSLLSALGASLGKSWLADYAQFERKPNTINAYDRHRRYIAISDWHLVDVIAFLPILLHTSFLLFACGLIVLMFGNNKPIGAIIFVLTTVALTLYLGTTMAPLVYPDCPFRTPLTSFLVNIAVRLFNDNHSRRRDLSMASKEQMLRWLHDLWYGSAENLIDKFGDSDKNVRLIVLHGIRTLCEDGIILYNLESSDSDQFPAKIQANFIRINGVKNLIEKFGDPDNDVRLTAINGIKALCVYGIMFCNLSSSNSHHFPDVIRTNFSLIHGLEKLIKKLEDSNKDVQKAALDCVKVLCVHGITFSSPPSSHSHHFPDDIRTKFISTNNLEKLIERLDDSDLDMRKTALDFVKALCVDDIILNLSSLGPRHVPDVIRTTFISTKNFKKLVERLDDPDKDVQKTVLDCIKALCGDGILFLNLPSLDSDYFLDVFRTRFIATNSFDKLIESLDDSDLDLQKTGVGFVKALCVHGIIFLSFLPSDSHHFPDDFRMRFIWTDGLKKLMQRLDDSDKDTWRIALDCVKALCGDGIAFSNISPSDSHHCPGEIRTKFILTNGVEKIIERFDDLDKDVRKTALDSVKALCVHGSTFSDLLSLHSYHFPDDIRIMFISINGVDKLVENLDNLDWEVQKATLDCVKALYVYGTTVCDLAPTESHHFLDNIRTKFILTDGVKKIIESLDDLNVDVRKTAVGCVKALCIHSIIFSNLLCSDSHHFLGDLRSKFISTNGIEKIIARHDNSKGLWDTTFHCVRAIFDNGITFSNLLSSDSHHFLDDIRTTYISTGGIEKLVMKLSDSHKVVRQIALVWIQIFCVHGIRFADIPSSDSHHCPGDIRTKFILTNGVENLIKRLDDSDKDVQKTAVRCLKTLHLHGITFCKHPSSNSHHFPDDFRTRFNLLRANGAPSAIKNSGEMP